MNRSEKIAILLGALLALSLVACQARRATLPPAVSSPKLTGEAGPVSRSTQATVLSPAVDPSLPVTTPEPFAFPNRDNVSPDTLIVSDPIIIQGITAPAPISIERGEYSLDGGPFTREEGLVRAGQRVTVRHTSSAGPGSYASTVLTIGGVSDIFSSVTAGVAGGSGGESSPAAVPAPRPIFPSKGRGRAPTPVESPLPGDGGSESPGREPTSGHPGGQPFLRGTQ